MRSPTAVCTGLVQVALSFSVLLGCFIPRELINCGEFCWDVLLKNLLTPLVCVLVRGEVFNMYVRVNRGLMYGWCNCKCCFLYGVSQKSSWDFSTSACCLSVVLFLGCCAHLWLVLMWMQFTGSTVWIEKCAFLLLEASVLIHQWWMMSQQC